MKSMLIQQTWHHLIQLEERGVLTKINPVSSARLAALLENSPVAARILLIVGTEYVLKRANSSDSRPRTTMTT